MKDKFRRFQLTAKMLFAASSNQGKLYRFGGENVAEGTFESPVLDAKSAATWGRIWWSSAGNVTIQTRSGNTEKPDESWSGWSASYTDQKGSQVAKPESIVPAMEGDIKRSRRREFERSKRRIS